MTTPATQTADPLDLLTSHARLPGAGLLLDPDRLSALLGREVALDRVRIKPCAGVLISHRAAPVGTEERGHALADVGWVQLVDSRDKRDGILRRAARGGIEVTEHPEAIRAARDSASSSETGSDTGDVPFLLSGGIDSDPRLGREIHSVLRRLRTGAAPRVLSYNPGRHVVLTLPDSGEVLRVAGRSLEDLLQVSRHWEDLGLPVTAQSRWKDRPAVLVSEHWGTGDLAGLADHPQAPAAARRLGEVIARLHTADVEGRDLPSARIGAVVPATTDAVRDLLPHRARRLDRLSQRLQGSMEEMGPQVLIHGDLSPDQVLLAPTGDGPEIRVVDLDRSGLGPRSADLGSWLAACLLEGSEGAAAAFLAGYADHSALPSPEELATWTARALLSAALDPMRRYSEAWLPAVEERLALAETVLDRPDRLPLPQLPATPASTPASAPTPLVPAQLEHDGELLLVRRAWADDGRGLPLELEDAAGSQLRAARLNPATGEVSVFEAGTDPRLPALARVLAEDPGSEIVSHRPGKRAVVRTSDPQGRTRYVKIVRRGRTEKLLAAIARTDSFDGPFRTAPVLASDEETVTFAELPGHLLHDGLPTEDGTWQRAWRATLDAWTDAVETSRTRPLPPGVHGPVEEAELLEDWCERADVVDPAGAQIRGRAVEAALSELSRLSDVERPALIHRDLHDKQILWLEGHPPALLDVDTATTGDPALDAANLRAHATWRELQGIWSADQAAVMREEVDRAAGRAGIEPQVLAAYESGTIARLACVYSFRPQWRQAATALAASLVPGSPASPASTASPAGPGSPTEPTIPLGGESATRLERSMSR